MERYFEMHPADAAAKLAWLMMAGVDTPVDEAPRRWLKPAPPPEPAAAMTAASGTAPAHLAHPKPAPAPYVARPSFADNTVNAPTLERLAECVTEFAHPLRRPDLAATLLTGNVASGVLILCDQPEEHGSPAAILRTRMLAAIGLDAENSALLYRLPWPTTGARAPRAEELAAFAPFVSRALELAGPRLMLALGQHAAAIAGEPMALASARGRWATVTIGDVVIPLLATCLPRLLLSQPARKREAWADLQAFSARLLETE